MTCHLTVCRYIREFDAMGLKRSDSVAILSSSSFPVCAQHVKGGGYRHLKVLLILSLGSSTWGRMFQAHHGGLAEQLRERLYTKQLLHLGELMKMAELP